MKNWRGSEGLAAPGGICLARNVYNQVKSKLDLAFEPMGEHRVKNIAEPVVAYGIRLDSKLPNPVLQLLRHGRLRRWRGATAAVLAVLFVTTLVGWLLPSEKSRVAKSVMPDRPSMAVLAFENFSDDPEQDFLAKGIAEDIITELSRNPDLFVVARHSSFSFQGRGMTAQEIARALGMRYVLEGSVRRARHKLRISAQLIDGETGGHTWAERFDLRAAEVYEIQDQVIENIAGRLFSGVRETQKGAALRRPPDSLDVYDLTLRGLAHKHRLTRESPIEGREELERAVELDPDYAPAHLYLGYLNSVDIGIGSVTGRYGPSDIDVAIRSIRRSIELDPNLATAYQALSAALANAGRLDDALEAAEKAVELGPSDAENLLFLGSAETKLGRYEEGLSNIQRAMELNPFAPSYYHSFLARALYAQSQLDEAVKAGRACATLAPRFSQCRMFLAASLASLGKVDEAGAQVTTLLDLAPHFSIEAAAKVPPYPGDPEMTARYLNDLRAAGLPEHAPDGPSS